MFRSLPIVDVYVAAIPEQINLTELYPNERQHEIDKVTNQKLKRQKWCSWKLLEYAMCRSFGIKMNQTLFFKSATGKWLTDKCEFSLSHCDGAVAVALSRKCVGVDIENQRSFSCEKIAGKILTEKEKWLYKQLSSDKCKDFLLEKWTAKESLFKRDGKKIFLPSEYDTSEGNLFTKSLVLGQKTYVLSVATDTPEVVRIYSDIEIFEE